MKKEDAKSLWPLVKAFGEGETVQILDALDQWQDLNSDNDLPFPYSAASYRIKPKEIVVDMSVLVKSGIDCEFSDYPDFSDRLIDKLVSIQKKPYDEYPFRSDFGLDFIHVRPRMNHLHAWTGGECPLPKGVLVAALLRDNNPVLAHPCQALLRQPFERPVLSA